VGPLGKNVVQPKYPVSYFCTFERNSRYGVVTSRANVNLKTCGQGCRELQRGLGKHFCGAPREKILEFFFKWCIMVYFVLFSDGGAPQTSWGPG